MTVERVELDIVIPVYDEGENITAVFDAIRQNVQTQFRILICYDFEEDNTLEAIERYPSKDIQVELVRNHGKGPHAAVRAGFAAAEAPAVLVYMADDDYNTGLIDEMVAKLQSGCDLVAASRFSPGGCMEGCSSSFKEGVTKAGTFLLHNLAGIPVHDGTNAFRLFSRRLLERVEIESRVGFTFSIELLSKAVRLGWSVDEVPAQWFERTNKPSRFRTIRWLPAYIRWLIYAMSTRWLRRGPETVR